MPAGDAQRVWFPEMIDELATSWSKAMGWDELADFCSRMTEIRKKIRHERGIQPPRIRCSNCGKVSRSDISGVSIRSALFALKKHNIITEAEFKDLEKSWMKYKARNDLDAYGRKAQKSRGKTNGVDGRC